MNVSELMTRGVLACSIDDTLEHAAQILWENDCGCLPVVDGDDHVVGMITDRDICMAGYTQGKLYAEIPVSSAMAKQVYGVTEGDLIATAEALMRDKQVRRLPVLEGGKLRGIVSLNDLARHTVPTQSRKSDGLSGDAIATTLAAISAPHAPKRRPRAASAAKMKA